MKQRILTLSGPSGVGKTTLLYRLLANDLPIHRVVSFTTRKPRPNEIEGQDYHFVTHADVIRRQSEIIEHTTYDGNVYGIFGAEIEEPLSKGLIPLAMADVEGIRQLSQMYVINAMLIMPPTLETLKERLIKDGRDLASIERRIQTAEQEISDIRETNVRPNVTVHEFVNDDLDACVNTVESFISSKKLLFSLGNEVVEANADEATYDIEDYEEDPKLWPSDQYEPANDSLLDECKKIEDALKQFIYVVAGNESDEKLLFDEYAGKDLDEIPDNIRLLQVQLKEMISRIQTGI